jgi:hypothetical protein
MGVLFSASVNCGGVKIDVNFPKHTLSRMVHIVNVHVVGIMLHINFANFI